MMARSLQRFALASFLACISSSLVWPQGGPPGQGPGGPLLPRGYRILVRDHKGNLDAIQKILDEQDLPPKEVRIEAYVLSIELNRTNNNGIDLDFFFGATKEDLPLGEFSTANNLRSAGANQQFRFGSLSTERFQLFLDFLRRNTQTRILSKPVLTVLDGQPATINIGQQIPYVLTTVVPGLPGQSPVQGTQVNFAAVGINLRFTPQIMPNDIVRMSLSPEISDVSGSPQPNAPPPTTRQTVQTTLFVKNRHAFLIGGLYRVDTSGRNQRLPLLSNLPIIGEYFGEKQDTRHRSEVVFVVRPTITSEDDFEPKKAVTPGRAS